MSSTTETVAGRASFDFTDRVAMIVGGSKGIGADTARAFAEVGASVVVAARDLDRLRSVTDEINAAAPKGVRAVPVRADVTDPASVEELVATTVAEFGRLDFAFNNAESGPPPTPIVDLEVAAFDSGIDSNLRGTFLGMKYQIPALLASGGGAIVNMASGAGISAITNLGAYVAGKSGVIALSKVAALECADQGIRVNVVAPGPIRTHHIVAAGERAQELAAGSVPMRRIGETRDVSDVVLWLCSDRSAFVTGVTIPIDGGQTAGSKPAQMYSPGKPMD
jgi:NAD(P)-dependent dehydrogenase (short-subunit alcohol dehydrogenase family)